MFGESDGVKSVRILSPAPPAQLDSTSSASPANRKNQGKLVLIELLAAKDPWLLKMQSLTLRRGIMLSMRRKIMPLISALCPFIVSPMA
jgi:hypothetical protein